MPIFCDIIKRMSKKILFSLVAMLTIAGCNINNEYDEYNPYMVDMGCENPNAGIDGMPCIRRADGLPAADVPGVKEIRYSTPNGNDLVLETPEYVLQIEGASGKKYDYYVWTGNHDYTNDPDLIIQDGNAAVLVVE